ncbi:MAG: adenylate/guanylate cyclase domain-containing protein [Alphaproteobacteria bacterium]|nr:adenylate/guanylate cyclase domain-containing protein [Alphaproteobacteria bacterium]
MQNFLVHPLARSLILFCILGGLVSLALDEAGIKARISNIVFETYMKAKPRPPSGKLVFVDIDDESVTKIGQWPWPRKTMADLITAIDHAGAAVIIFDGVLAEPDRTSPENIASLLEDGHPAKALLAEMPANDALLAQAIKSTGKFVAGFSYGSNTAAPQLTKKVLVKKDIENFFLSRKDFKEGYFATTAQFLPSLQKAAAGNGSFMASAENDAVIRRTGVIFHNQTTLYPSLVLEGVRLYEHDGKEHIKLKERENYNNFSIMEPFVVQIGRYEIPVDVEGKMWVSFRAFRDEENISAYKFIGVAQPPDLKGKIVFIASSAEGLMDLRATPLGMQPGVRVHMNALEQILQHKYLVRPYTANILEIGAAAGVAALIILLSFFVNPLWLALIVAAVSGGAFWVSWVLFALYGGLFDPVTPTAMIVSTFIAASVLSYLKTEFEKRQVRDAFGLYISPDFMAELTKSPDKLKLGGEIRDLTVLFSDIRSFTSISEGLTPEELIQLMNDFLTPMSDLVMQNRGTIDKYMGDAMMAFWNAPLDDENHARHACQAALGMSRALAPINEELARRADEQGKKPVILKAGIGLNTGACAVGNMGSRQRFAYSALGDAVNLVSRLEGQTKTYGVEILIGEQTRIGAPEMAALEMDLIAVKGKTEPVRVFALLGNEDAAQNPDFIKLEQEHNTMIEAYRAGNFESALDVLKECRKQKLYSLEIAYDLYEGRIKESIKNPPESWDGVFRATSK